MVLHSGHAYSASNNVWRSRVQLNPKKFREEFDALARDKHILTHTVSQIPNFDKRFASFVADEKAFWIEAIRINPQVLAYAYNFQDDFEVVVEAISRDKTTAKFVRPKLLANIDDLAKEITTA